jgi:hypothetical protein
MDAREEEEQRQNEQAEARGDEPEGQVSEVVNLAEADQPIQPSDAVAGSPADDPAHPVQEGPTGPDAPMRRIDEGLVDVDEVDEEEVHEAVGAQQAPPPEEYRPADPDLEEQAGRPDAVETGEWAAPGPDPGDGRDS